MKVSEQQVKDLIVEICQIDEEKIVSSAKLKEDLQMDSLNIADLMASLEEDFEVSVVQEEAMKIKTFGELIEYIKNH
ncbi:MAG: acyl carrier protein [Bacteriovoracaceae bacterium]